MTQDDDRPMVERHLPEGTLQLVPFDHRPELIGTVSDVLREDADLTDGRLLPPGLGIAGMHKQPVAPAIELGRIPQAADVAPDVEECLLRGIFGQVSVSQDAVGDSE